MQISTTSLIRGYDTKIHRDIFGIPALDLHSFEAAQNPIIEQFANVVVRSAVLRHNATTNKEMLVDDRAENVHTPYTKYKQWKDYILLAKKD